MDPIYETVIFPDRPLFLKHHKRPENGGSINLSRAKLNGFVVGSSAENERSASHFEAQSQPNPSEGVEFLAKYRKIKFIDNNIADITKRRSARPRQVRSKRLRVRYKTPQSCSSTSTDETVSGSIGLASSDALALAKSPIEEAARQPPTSNPTAASTMNTTLLLTVPRSEPNLYSERLSLSLRNIMPAMIRYCRCIPIYHSIIGLNF